MQVKSWVIFLDMLGTKESSKLSENEFSQKITEFIQTAKSQAISLNCNVSMRIFSDSIYIEIDNFEELKYFCQSIILRLFSQNIFFKGAICEGILDEKSVGDLLTTKEGFTKDIRGSAFGKDVIPAYYEQENFKGVGFIYVPGKLKHSPAFKKFSNKHLIKSAFPIADNRLTLKWQPYYDVKFEYKSLESLIPVEQEEGEDLLNTIAGEGGKFIECIVNASLRAERSKKYLSRYYLSMLHSLIESSDFSGIIYQNDKWCNYPIIFHVLQRNQNFRREILKIRGAETLYLHIAEKILTSKRKSGETMRDNHKFDGTVDTLIDELSRMKIIGKTFPSLPSFIISEQTKQYIASKEVNNLLSGKFAQNSSRFK